MKSRSKRLFVLAWSAALVIGFVVWLQREPQPAPVGVPSLPDRLPLVAPASLHNSLGEQVQHAAPGAHRRFANIGVLEANAILMEIKKQNLAAILRILLEAGRMENDLTKQVAVTSILASAIQDRAPDPEFMARLEKFVLEGTNTLYERGLILGVLNTAATKEAVDVLIRIATSVPEQELGRIAMSGIGRLGAGGGMHEYLSPSLERAWRESRDQELLVFVAVAMAQVGSTSSVDLLLASALGEGGADVIRARAAEAALAQATMLNPNTVPALATRLVGQPPGGEVSKVIAATLVRMGISAAGAALVQWLRNADESAAATAYECVVRSRTETMLAQWEAALSPAVTFHSEKNREAVRAGLTKYRESIR